MNQDIVAHRELTEADSGEKIIIEILRPYLQDDNAICDYNIKWPNKIEHGSVSGIDEVQAISLCLQRIGAIIYTNKIVDINRLIWLEQGGGFGFFLPKTLRDLYIGDDKNL